MRYSSDFSSPVVKSLARWLAPDYTPAPPFFFSFTFSGEIPLIFNDTPDGHPLRVNEPGKRHRNFPEKSTYLDNARFILLANANWDWAFKNRENRWNFTLFVIEFSFFSPLFPFWWAVILLEEWIMDSAFFENVRVRALKQGQVWQWLDFEWQ